MIKKKTTAAAPPKPEFTMQQRMGRFSLEDSLLTDMPEVGTKVMNGVMVVQCTHNFLTNSFDYLGVSEHFEGVEEGGDIPSYDVSWDEEAGEASWTKAE